MSNVFRILRSTTAAARPTGRQFGELYWNDEDRALGIIDSTGTPHDIIDTNTFGNFIEKSPTANTNIIQPVGNVAVTPLTVKGLAAQTAPLFIARDSTDFPIASIGADGSFVSKGTGGRAFRAETLPTTSAFAYEVTSGMAGAGPSYFGVSEAYGTGSPFARIFNNDAGRVGFEVRGFAGQTENLQQWRDSAGTLLARVNNSGNYQQSTYSNTAATSGSVITDTTVATSRLNTMVATLNAGPGTGSGLGLAIDIFDPTYRGMRIRAAAGQTGNMAEFRTSSDTITTWIKPNAQIESIGIIKAAQLEVGVLDNTGTPATSGVSMYQAGRLEWSGTQGRGRLGASGGGYAGIISQVNVTNVVGLAIQAAPTQSASLVYITDSASAVISRITAAGNVGGVGAYTNLSDEREKTAIASLDTLRSTSVIEQLIPRKFKYNSTGEEAFGFIAQEVQAVLPEAVTVFAEAREEEVQPADDNGGPYTIPAQEERLGLQSEQIIPHLVMAVQQLMARLEALEAAT